MTREDDNLYSTLPITERVYRTLRTEQDVAHAFAWLVNHLREKQILSDDDIKNMLDHARA